MSTWYMRPGVTLTKEQVFGELRSLFSRQSHYKDWQKLCAILGSCEVSNEELEHEIVPYALTLLLRRPWEGGARVPEFDWVGYGGSALSPLVLLCDRVCLQSLGCNALTLERIFNHSYMANVKVLDIDGHVFTDEIAEIFVQSKLFHSLRSMSFAMNTLTAQGLSLFDRPGCSFYWGSYGERLHRGTMCHLDLG